VFGAGPIPRRGNRASLGGCGDTRARSAATNSHIAPGHYRPGLGAIGLPPDVFRECVPPEHYSENVERKTFKGTPQRGGFLSVRLSGKCAASLAADCAGSPPNLESWRIRVRPLGRAMEAHTAPTRRLVRRLLFPTCFWCCARLHANRSGPHHAAALLTYLVPRGMARPTSRAAEPHTRGAHHKCSSPITPSYVGRARPAWRCSAGTIISSPRVNCLSMPFVRTILRSSATSHLKSRRFRAPRRLQQAEEIERSAARAKSVFVFPEEHHPQPGCGRLPRRLQASNRGRAACRAGALDGIRRVFATRLAARPFALQSTICPPVLPQSDASDCTKSFVSGRGTGNNCALRRPEPCI